MKLKIWHKMIIGITIPSLIALLGGMLTYGYMNDMKHRQGIVRIADDLKEHVLEIRRNERNFLHDKKDEHYRNLYNAILKLTSAVNTVLEGESDLPGKDGLSVLYESLKVYSGLTGRLNNSFQKESEITRKVTEEGKNLETLAVSIPLAKELSTSFILRLRLLEKNYMFFRDEKSLLEYERGLQQIKNVTPVCYECAPYVSAVNTLISTFKESDALSGKLKTGGDRMEAAAESMSVYERERISSFITRTQKLLLAALILLCLLGPLFVYRTSSFIVAPIKRLAEITRKISQGDISLRAPIKEQDETYSLAVSFNRMLDSLVETQRSLKQSLELLNEKQAQLVEAEKRASMGFLVAGVAHELNNPLNNISLTAETMMEEIRELSPVEINTYVKDILLQSDRAHTIVANLLDFARARKSASMEKQDIVRIVSDSLQLVASQLRVRHIELIKEIPDRPYHIKGNRSKLEQVIISIITNGMQAITAPGILKVSVEADEKAKSVTIKISDNGKGIPGEDLKNIFEPFFTTKPPGEGTGLGLAVSNTLVSEHHGEIRVESTVGSGTTFTVRLPLLE